MTEFHDVRFPLALGFGARGGPSLRTDITRLASGAEHRNSPHDHARRRYDVGPGVKSLEDLSALIRFFQARKGQRHSFRFRDPLDHQSGLPGATLSMSDETIGMGDGVQTVFQLIKVYEDAGGRHERIITKPIAGTLLLAAGGQFISATLDTDSGQVSFDTPPGTGQVITAGFQFDVPVRFDTDHLAITLETFQAGTAGSVPLIEVPDHA